MNLDELKNKWQEYDKVLQQHKMLNEQMVNLMLKGKSKSAISNILNFEYLGLLVSCLLLTIYVLQFGTAFYSMLMTVAYFTSFIFIVAGVVIFYYKYKLLKSIDMNVSNLVDTANRVEHFRLFIIKERMATIIVSPIIISSLVVVFAKWVLNIDVQQMPDIFLPRIIIGTVILIISMLVLYKLLYFDNINKIKANLAEIEFFKT